MKKFRILYVILMSIFIAVIVILTPKIQIQNIAKDLRGVWIVEETIDTSEIEKQIGMEVSLRTITTLNFYNDDTFQFVEHTSLQGTKPYRSTDLKGIYKIDTKNQKIKLYLEDKNIKEIDYTNNENFHIYKSQDKRYIHLRKELIEANSL